MGYGEYESYFVREEEMNLILAGAGVTKWYGLTSGSRVLREKVMVTKEDVYRILAGLYQKEYIEWENGAVRFLEPVNTMVVVLKNAKHFIQIESGQQEGFLKGCYFSRGKIVLLEKSILETDMLKFSLWEEKDFLAYLWETGIFPEEEGVLDNSNSLVLKNIESGIEEAQIVLTEEGIFPYMTIGNGLENKKYLYQKEVCEDIIKNWFHGSVEK